MTRLIFILTITMLSCSSPKNRKAKEPTYFFVTDSGVVHADFCIGTYDKPMTGKLISPKNSDIHKYKVCSSCVNKMMATLTDLGLEDVAEKFIRKDSIQLKEGVQKKKLDW